MNKRNIICAICFVLSGLCSVVSHAQSAEGMEDMLQPPTQAQGTLSAQSYAVDYATQRVLVINEAENTVELISKHKGTFRKDTAFLIDKKEGRHDLYAVFTPRSVAFCKGNIVLLAQSRDSAYVRILSPDLRLLSEVRLRASLQAIGYDEVSEQLYLVGSGANNYDVFSFDVSNGFSGLTLDQANAFQYVKPKKSEELAKKDPTGGGLALIAVLVVFFVLILVSVVLSIVFGKLIAGRANRKSQQANPQTAVAQSEDQNAEEESERVAAVVAAVHLYLSELHDKESGMLTIKRREQTASAWSAKTNNINPYRR